jgi:solute carrier family 25 uncoupling protein 8/9
LTPSLRRTSQIRENARLTSNGSAIKFKLTYASFAGSLPNIARTAIINVGEIVVYDIVKDLLISNRIMNDGIACHFNAAVAAGFAATVIASPVDVIKTR